MEAPVLPAQWKTRPESMTTVWPVMVSVRHMATTISAQSSLSAGFFSSDVVAERGRHGDSPRRSYSSRHDRFELAWQASARLDARHHARRRVGRRAPSYRRQVWNARCRVRRDAARVPGEEELSSRLTVASRDPASVSIRQPSYARSLAEFLAALDAPPPWPCLRSSREMSEH